MCTKSELQVVLKKVKSAAQQLYGSKLIELSFMAPMPVGIIRMS